MARVITSYARWLLAWLGIADEARPFEETVLEAPDGSARATFISLGATLCELWVKDAHGKMRDVVLGYDDRSQWLTDPAHPVFGALVGRYAGRIAGGRFKIGKREYQVAANDAGGAATLHGGEVGWDRRAWRRVSHTASTVTYEWVDRADEGFPGTVVATVTYELAAGPVWHTRIRCTASEATPIMLTSHAYWNLDAFQGADGQDALGHTVRIAASKMVEVSATNHVPTGNFLPVDGTPYDFRAPHTIQERLSAVTAAGPNGYNDNFVYDTAPADRKADEAVFSLWSELSGIRMDVRTNQPSVILYTGNYLSSTPRKAAHGDPGSVYAQYAGVAVEQQGLVDAVNHKEWDREAETVFGPGKDFEWTSSYAFSTIPTSAA